MPTQTPQQQQAALSAAGLSSSQQAGVTTGQGYSPTPITPSSITDPTSPIQLPNNPSATNGQAVNSSIPTPESIIQDANKPTTAETQQTGLLGRVAELLKGKTSLATQQTQQETAAGVPALTSTVNDLTTQLEGLNNQATALQNAAGAGGSIENQLQQQSEGRGITAGGLAPLQAGELRKNQIQQSALASQSLTLKSALFAAQGKFTLAKDAADKAAQVAFDAKDKEINYQNALLAALQPQLDKEQKNQAVLLQAQLQDRAQKIQNQRDDYKTGQAAIADALKNNPTNAQAQFAAQQALKLDPNEPQYLTKVYQLVSPYGTDIAKRTVEMQLTQAQADKAKTDAEKSRSTINDTGDTVASLSQQIVDGFLAPAELSKRTSGAGANYNAILKAADDYSMKTYGTHFDISKADRDYKYANNPQTQNTLNYLGSLVGGSGQKGNLDELVSLSDAVAQPKGFFGGKTNFPALNNVQAWAKLQAGDPTMAAYYATVTEVADQIAKILQGGGTGSGTSDAKLAQASSLFQVGFSKDQIKATADALRPLLQNRAQNLVKDNPYLKDYAQQFGIQQKGASNTTRMKGPDGNLYDVPNDKVDDFKKGGGTVSFNSVGGDTNIASAVIPKGSLASANNNPANLRFAGQAGAQQGKGGFASFSSIEAGVTALVNQIKLDAQRGLSLAAFISKFAPPSENNTRQYIQQIAAATSTSANTPIAQISPQILAQAIAKKESGTNIRFI